MNYRYPFSRSATESYLRRVTDDATSAARKSRTVRAVFRLSRAMSPVILKLTPTSLLPILDCTVYRDL